MTTPFDARGLPRASHFSITLSQSQMIILYNPCHVKLFFYFVCYDGEMTVNRNSYISGATSLSTLPQSIMSGEIFLMSDTEMLVHCFNVSWKSFSTLLTTGLL